MNAVLKKVGRKSAEDLQAEVEALERSLAEAQRARDTARYARPRLIVEDDAQALRQNKQVIDLAERDVTNLAATLESMREALRLAQERDRGESRQASYRAIQVQAKATREAVVKLDEALTAFARAYPAAARAVEKLDTTLVNNGCDAADPTQLRAKLRGIVELGLFVPSDGVFGRGGIDSIDQLRVNGRASLRHAVSEFVEVILRRARGRFVVEG